MPTEKPGFKTEQSLDKVTLTLHEAKEIVGLLGVIYTLLTQEQSLSTAKEEMYNCIDKMRWILIKAKLVEGL